MQKEKERLGKKWNHLKIISEKCLSWRCDGRRLYQDLEVVS